MTDRKSPSGIERMLVACVLASLSIGGTLALFQAPPAVAAVMLADARPQSLPLA
jgi:hypothetical protein